MYGHESMMRASKQNVQWEGLEANLLGEQLKFTTSQVVVTPKTLCTSYWFVPGLNKHLINTTTADSR